MQAVFSDVPTGQCSSGRASGFSRFADLDQPARPDVVDVAVDRDPSGDEGMAADPTHVFDDALLAIGDREPVDLLASVEPGPLPTSRNPSGPSLAVSG